MPTVSIPLKDGKFALIDGEDFPAIKGLTLYLGQNGYVYFSQWIDGASKPQTLHSLLVDAPEGTHIDHINGDKLDNRRSVNLRVVSPQINQVNRKRLNRNNTSGVRGVQYCPHLSPTKPWRAQITANNRAIHIGLFETKELAIQARRDAEVDLFGEECPCPAPGF